MMLMGCAGDPVSGDSSAAASSTPSATGNTLSSVLGSFKTNLRVNAIFNFLGSSATPSIIMDYVEKGVQFTYKNFDDSFVDGGFLNDSDGKAYAWNLSEVEHWNESTSKAETVDLAVKTGSAIKNKAGDEVSSFRDAYYDPSYIGEHLDEFTAENVFVPQIAGTTFGWFDLLPYVYESDLENRSTLSEEESTEGEALEEEESSEAVESEPEHSGKLLKDNTEILATLSKCLGVYDTTACFGSGLELNSAEFYFAEKGSAFSFNLYYTYNAGYDKLKVTVSVSKIGSASVEALDNYFDPNFEVYVPEVSS